MLFRLSQRCGVLSRSLFVPLMWLVNVLLLFACSWTSGESISVLLFRSSLPQPFQNPFKTISKTFSKPFQNLFKTPSKPFVTNSESFPNFHACRVGFLDISFSQVFGANALSRALDRAVGSGVYSWAVQSVNLQRLCQPP